MYWRRKGWNFVIFPGAAGQHAYASKATPSPSLVPCTHRKLAAISLVRNQARLHHRAPHHSNAPLLPCYLLLECGKKICCRSRQHKAGVKKDAPAARQHVLPGLQLCITAAAADPAAVARCRLPARWERCKQSLPPGPAAESRLGHAVSWRQGGSGSGWRWRRGGSVPCPCCCASLRSCHAGVAAPRQDVNSAPPGRVAGASEHPGRLGDAKQ